MIDLQIFGPSNDLVVVDGDLTLIGESAAIRQAVLQILQTFAGEWFLDTTKGIPYFQQVFVKNPNLDLIQAVMQRAITDVPGIASLNAFNFDYNNGLRELSITFQATSTNGQIIKAQTSIGV